MIAGQVSNYTRAKALQTSLPAVEKMITDRGYYADWLREALKYRELGPCIAGRKSCDEPIRCDR